jgi:hypothetical protein
VILDQQTVTLDQQVVKVCLILHCYEYLTFTFICYVSNLYISYTFYFITLLLKIICHINVAFTFV